MRLLLLLAVVAVSFAAALAFGSSELGPAETLGLVLAKINNLEFNDDQRLAWSILTDLRAPRAVVAALAGGALAAAGTLSQGLFRNPLASPSVLGVEAGAVLAAASAFYLGAAQSHWLTVPLAAFAGAVVISLVILSIAARPRPTGPLPLEHLLLVGFALNALIGAGTSFLVSLVLEDYQKAAALLHWMLGGFSAKGWEHAASAITPLVLGTIAAFALAARLDVLALGEDVARTLSVDVRRVSLAAIAAIAALVGAAVAAGGALPFVGLLVPHAMRLVLGPNHKRLLTGSILAGMSLVLWADLAARTLRSPREIEVGILTSLAGAPVFLYLLFRRRA